MKVTRYNLGKTTGEVKMMESKRGQYIKVKDVKKILSLFDKEVRCPECAKKMQPISINYLCKCHMILHNV